jgi:hypothetical protein
LNPALSFAGLRRTTAVISMRLAAYDRKLGSTMNALPPGTFPARADQLPAGASERGEGTDKKRF